MAEDNVTEALAVVMAARARYKAAKQIAFDAVPGWPHAPGPLDASQVGALNQMWGFEADLMGASRALLAVHAPPT